MKLEKDTKVKYKKFRVRLWGAIYTWLLGIIALFFAVKIIFIKLMHNGLYVNDTDMLMSLYGSSFCLLISNGFLLAYFGNKIFITDSTIIIKRGALGITYTIAKSFIFGKGFMFIAPRGANQYEIILLLKNGRKVKTGFLNCKDNEFKSIYNRFNFFEIERGKKLKEVLPVEKRVEMGEEDFKVETNYFFTVLTFFPLALLVVLIYFLMTL